MRKLLEDLYFGSITPHDRQMTESSDLRRLVKHTERFQSQLREKLGEEDQPILQKLTEAQSEVDSIVALENFILGFRLGVRLMAECMDENDGDLIEERDCL